MGRKQKYPKQTLGFFSGLLGILLATTGMPSSAGCPCNYTPAKLVEVIAADTLLLQVANVEETVKVSGIRAPRLESHRVLGEAWCEAEGEKALQARDHARTLLMKASEISIDETDRLASGDLVAVVYIDNVSFGQELLYKYLAVETDDTSNWCP
tara:strand:- start:125 stop:586 length:462 start_codon:yes stop_codon:yes gene_type:complete